MIISNKKKQTKRVFIELENYLYKQTEAPMKNTRSRASSQKVQPKVREEHNQKPKTFIIKKTPLVANKTEQSTAQPECISSLASSK